MYLQCEQRTHSTEHDETIDLAMEYKCWQGSEASVKYSKSYEPVQSLLCYFSGIPIEFIAFGHLVSFSAYPHGSHFNPVRNVYGAVNCYDVNQGP